MRDDEIVQGILDEVASVLLANVPGVASVLPSTTAEDLVFQDAEGQLPAIGVCEIDVDVVGPVGVGQKRHRATVSLDLAIAVQNESSAPEGRAMARGIWGYTTKALHNRLSTVTHAMGRYQHGGYVWVDHPRQDLQLMKVRFRIDALLGHE